jgi:hypothetical protein
MLVSAISLPLAPTVQPDRSFKIAEQPMAVTLAKASVSGAIWTTDDLGGVNINLFTSKELVYLNGGPAHEGAAGLPDGYYYCKVTEPNGTLLGTTIGSGNDTPIEVVNGEFVLVYRLWDILIKASDGTQGYDDTGNTGGEYKVWASQNPDFPNAESKTDNFKVDEQFDPQDLAELIVIKFYDANANGVNDDEEEIIGWKIILTNGLELIRYTPVSVLVEPGDYTVIECEPLEENWMPTTENPVYVTLGAGETVVVEFGNLCLGPGGGKTIGFWRNKNGQRMIGPDDLNLLTSLNLVDAYGSPFDPGSKHELRSWLKNATAVNMAYMLSAQLAAMKLNVFNGLVDGNALIYAPGTTSANALGFATVNDVMDEANTELGINPYTDDESPHRDYQEALKDALDNANNNLTFVQPGPCPFTFPE